MALSCVLKHQLVCFSGLLDFFSRCSGDSREQEADKFARVRHNMAQDGCVCSGACSRVNHTLYLFPVSL